jgi:hypothetical protein
MDDKNDAAHKVSQGLMPIDPSVLKEFLREMNDTVIPEIQKAVEERRLLAAESRQWQLKC